MCGLNIPSCHRTPLLSPSSLLFFYLLLLSLLFLIFSHLYFLSLSSHISVDLSLSHFPSELNPIRDIFLHLSLRPTSLPASPVFSSFPSLLRPLVSVTGLLPPVSLIHMHELTPRPSFHSLMCTGVQVDENITQAVSLCQAVLLHTHTLHPVLHLRASSA